jgi:hypothetical protein
MIQLCFDNMQLNCCFTALIQAKQNHFKSSVAKVFGRKEGGRGGEGEGGGDRTTHLSVCVIITLSTKLVQIPRYYYLPWKRNSIGSKVNYSWSCQMISQIFQW